MADRHINLFYSYNQDTELVENNLTRAWIVTLRLLSAGARARFLNELLDDTDIPIDEATFARAELALQAHVNRDAIITLPHRYLLTVATDPVVPVADDGLHLEDWPADLGGSVPDAWIVDPAAGICLLVEAKIGTNPLAARQLQAHARDWLGLATMEELYERLVPRTWYDVAQVLDLLLDEAAGGELSLNDQEVALLGELLEFLSFYGYRPFSGLTFAELLWPPYMTVFSLAVQATGRLWDFRELQPAPSFHLGLLAAQAVAARGLDMSGLQPPPTMTWEGIPDGTRRD